MTDRPQWDRDEDELVRQALSSLREDVEAQPMPEPAEIRARAERRRGAVVDLPSRRRRAFGAVAGIAAAALVATSAGFLTWNSSDVAPPETSTSFSATESTTSSSTPTEEGRLRMLDARDWAGVLGQQVSRTTSATTLAGRCFDPAEDDRWRRRVAELPDGTVPGSQWLGTAESNGAAPTSAVDAAIRRCRPEYTIQSVASGELADGSHRILHVTAGGGPDRWLVEASRGDQVTVLSITEGDGRSYSSAQMRRVALGVLGEVDLSAPSETSATSTTTTSADRPTTSGTTTDGSGSPQPSPTATAPDPTSTDSATPTTSAGPPRDDEGSQTSGDTSPSPPATSTTGSPSTSTTADPTTADPTTDPGTGRPEVGDVASRHFVDPSAWASPALTGDASSYGGPVEMEGRSHFTRCTGADGDDHVGAVGIRSGSGEANYFGQQWVLLTDDAGARYDELVAGFSSGRCTTGGTVSSLGNGVFRVDYGSFVTYRAVVRTSSGVSILHLSEAKTATEPLTDSVAASELGRLSGLAARR